MKTTALRLRQGDDLKQMIEALAERENIAAGCVLSAVGSLSQAKLRMAGATPAKQDVRMYGGPLEIVSLTGTVGESHCHLHIAVSNQEGNVLGGHLKNGCIVDTTVELVIGASDEYKFDEEQDKTTGFPEVRIRRNEK